MTENSTPWEDHLLERKTERKLQDLKRTAVAFANSVRPGHTAVILIGEENDGTVRGVTNPDEQQRSIRKEFDQIYPSIIWRQQLYELSGKTCIRVEIEYSGDTPHFGDAAWVRVGSESVRATDRMLQKLVDLRSSTTRELSMWIGKVLTVSWSASHHPTGMLNWTRHECRLEQVTTYFSTFANKQNVAQRRSEPNGWLESWDDPEDRLRVFVNPARSIGAPW
jgi:hypothetical protein